jgi:hypothetical protein
MSRGSKAMQTALLSPELTAAIERSLEVKTVFWIVGAVLVGLTVLIWLPDLPIRRSPPEQYQRVTWQLQYEAEAVKAIKDRQRVSALRNDPNLTVTLSSREGRTTITILAAEHPEWGVMADHATLWWRREQTWEQRATGLDASVTVVLTPPPPRFWGSGWRTAGGRWQMRAPEN